MQSLRSKIVCENVLELFAEETQIFKVNLWEQWQECDKSWGTMSVECT